MRKLLKASSFYPAYHRWVYERNPALRDLPYAEQHRALMADGFATADTWKHYLEKDGRFEVTEVVVNAEILQKRWALENGVQYGETTWLRDIFRAQCARFRPDVLYALANEVSINLEQYLDSFPQRPFVIGFDGVARHDDRLARNCDLVISCLERSVEYYKSVGCSGYFMAHGFDTRNTPASWADVPCEEVDLSFVGSLMVRIGHQERALALKYISDATPLAVWSGSLPSDCALIRTWASFLRHGDLKSAAAFPAVAFAVRQLRRLNRGELFGRAMLRQLAASRITLNVHIAAAGEEAANIRLFEATGAGTCLLTDWKPNLGRFFELDREIVAFKSRDEAVEKIRFLLANEHVCRDIAERGRLRTFSSHAVGDKLSEFSTILMTYLSK